MATTTPTTQQHLLRDDHLNVLNLRDVVFFSPPPPPLLHHQAPPIPAAAVGLGVSIFPLLPCLPTADFQVQQETQHVRPGDDNAAAKVCRDCGNRAKKECVHRRCRTCCRSHGYDCPTHLKSTWVSATKRRERQHQRDNYSQGKAFGANASAAAAGSSASNADTPRSSFDTISCPQDANFKRSLPGKVRAPAVFRRIRVTAIGDNASEIVYQTTVAISGHIFKGFLYNQDGIENMSIVCPSKSKFDEGARNRSIDASTVADQTVLASQRRSNSQNLIDRPIVKATTVFGAGE